MKKESVVLMAVAVLVVGLAVLGVVDPAEAFNAAGNATTGKGHELYDLIVTDFINGPIGTTTGTVFIVVGAIMAAMGKLAGAAWPLVGGGLLVAAPNIANSLGMIF